jgi:hypothetical protein
MNSDPTKESRPAKDESAKQKPGDQGPPPLNKKIPEPPGNLRRRSEWFRKRSEG